MLPDITIVIGVRLGAPDRARNLQALLMSLEAQDVGRDRFRIVLVEQDTKRRVQTADRARVDGYQHDMRNGPYNRSKALNDGARDAGEGLLCLMDADLFVNPTWIRLSLKAMETAQALLPFEFVSYLDEKESMRLIWTYLDGWGCNPKARRMTTESVGGAMWLPTNLYWQINGHDEQFEGWGSEDQDFYFRICKIATVLRMRGTIFHLYHDRDVSAAKANRRRLSNLHGNRELGHPTEFVG